MGSVPTLHHTEKAVVFTTSQNPLDTDLAAKIDERFSETGSDALVLGQGPVLSLGFIDPRDFSVLCPNNSSFAVSKGTFNDIGEPDLSLGSACAVDYLQRMRNAGKTVSLAIDIVMPCHETRPSDITELWLESLLLDAKHGNTSVKQEITRKLVSSLAHYDASIGN